MKGGNRGRMGREREIDKEKERERERGGGEEIPGRITRLEVIKKLSKLNY